MPVSFATLQLAKEYVNNEYPHLKIFQQIPVVKKKYCMVTISFGSVEFWESWGGWTFGF